MIEFRHSDAVWTAHPQLVPAVLYAEAVDADARVDALVDTHLARATARLASTSIAELPEIHAWRRAFAGMGVKPTQYRCASESLLRRLDKHGALPRIHPLVDLCNAISAASAIPIAVFDLAAIDGALEVRHATGVEEYRTFSDDVEHPAPGEIVYVDAAGQAHARRWTNRQSGASAVSSTTSRVLIVAEGLHPGAAHDVAEVGAAVVAALDGLGVTAKAALLSREAPTFTF